MKYRAVLFHPSGDYVTDFPSDNKQEIWENLCDMGSKWIFYPIPVIISDTHRNTLDCRIVDMAEGMEYMKRKKLKTFQSLLKKEWDIRPQEICDDLNSGFPLSVIY